MKLFNKFITGLALQLKEPLPGEKAQLLMGSDKRMKEFKFMPMSESTKKSAVMILLYPSNNTVYSILIQRPKYNGTHSGQVAFPGGKVEKTDENFEMTALRETSEEIGIDITNVVILGGLTRLYIPPSNFEVFPIVGYVTKKPEFKPDPNEVKDIIEYPLNILLKKETLKTKEFSALDNVSFVAPYYDIYGNIVWGATAMILSEFVEIVKKSDPKLK